MTLLRIYLEDHLAGAAAGVRRAQRLAKAEHDGPDADVLRTVAAEIDEDRQALNTVVDELGVEPRRYKQVLAAIVERIGLLKMNGRLLRRSPLSSIIETEMLLMAVRGKLAGWESLAATIAVSAGDRPAVTVDFDELVDRARRQLDRLAAVHARLAARVLGSNSA